MKPMPEEQVATPTLSDNVNESDMSVPLHDMDEPACHSVFEMDFASENWTQQLISTRLNESSLKQICAEIELEDRLDTTSEYTRHSAPFTIQPSGDPYFPSFPIGPDSNLTSPNKDRDLKAFQTPEQMIFPDIKDPDTSPWSYHTSRLDMQPLPNTWVVERPHQPIPILINPSDSNYCPLQSPETSPDSEIYSPDEPGELIRSSLRAGPDGSSEVQANMLMVVIVTIDSLLSTLDATATSAGAVDEEEFSSQSQYLANRNSQDRGDGVGFKSHVDACPLLVGGSSFIAFVDYSADSRLYAAALGGCFY
ncbi:uncharacterized protein N7484_010415 [Penicillium longicatenatum]|uniref:uncharacterized protein n=1 Tax=Penicillium longicatenatum TaxID=1561947 RepID=UPI002548D7E7|nr:uncharacterized protein N7484_010415 [Penicillium longicatenatum]KAJ5630315.1 hypothetical protein N7484_010415 [Penicillium longicatenatum]